MKTKHYIFIAVALLIIAILAIPAWVKRTSHIHAEDGTIINGDASYSDFACAYWKAKLFKKGGICTETHQPEGIVNFTGQKKKIFVRK